MVVSSDKPCQNYPHSNERQQDSLDIDNFNARNRTTIMRTDTEIKLEIAALEACKDYIPRMTAFGDDNHRNLDLQIEYLKGEIDTTATEFEEDFTDSERDAILEAYNWEDGAPESPSSGWDGYKPKTKKKNPK